MCDVQMYTNCYCVTSCVRVCVCVLSLVAPVQSDGDVSLDVSALVLRQVTGEKLPPQVDELHHHVADLVEEIHFVSLMERGGGGVRSIQLVLTRHSLVPQSFF